MQLKAGVINLNERHSMSPQIPQTVIDVWKRTSKPIKSPADKTDPGIAYPEVEIDIKNFDF